MKMRRRSASIVALVAMVMAVLIPQTGAIATGPGGNVGDDACEDYDWQEKWEYDKELGRYEYEKTTNLAGDDGSQRLNVSGDDKSGTFSVLGDALVGMVYVKGGPANDGGTPFDPAVASGGFDNSGLPNAGASGKPAGISNVTFCGKDTDPEPEIQNAKFKINKQLDGDGRKPTKPFGFSWECGEETGTAWLFGGKSTRWIHLEWTGSEALDCTVTETNTRGADPVSNSTGGEEVATFALNDGDRPTITFTNTFDRPPFAAKFKVGKVVDGDGEAPDLPFEFAWQCGEHSGEFSLEDGEQTSWVPVTWKGSHTIDCTVTETGANGASATSNSEGGEDEADFTLRKFGKKQVTFTNTFDREVFDIRFDVTKRVTGNGEAPEGEFPFSYHCHGQSGSFGLAGGETHTVHFSSENPGPFLCVVTETDTLGADRTTNTSGVGPIALLKVSKDKSPSVTFTNRFDLAPEVSSSNACDGLEITIDTNDEKSWWRIVDAEGVTVVGPTLLGKGQSLTEFLSWDGAPYQVQSKKVSIFHQPWKDFGDPIEWEQPDDCLEIAAAPICVADLTTKSLGPITYVTGGSMIFEVSGHNNGGPDGQEIRFNYRPAGSLHVQSGTVLSGDTTIVSSKVGIGGAVFVRIDGGTIKDRIVLKSLVDCSPSVTVEKEWTNVDDEWLDAYGVSVLFDDGGDNAYEPGEQIALSPGESIELTEHVDGLPEGCTWVAGEEDDLSWTAPSLEDLEGYLELWAGGDGVEGFHHVLTANNTVECGEPDISIVKSADQTEFSFGEDDEDFTYQVTYSYLVTNTGEVELDHLTLEDEVLTADVEQVVDLTAELNDAVLAEFGSTVLPVGGQVTVTWTATYDAEHDPSTIENLATVTGTDPFGEEVSDEDDETITSVIIFSEVEEQPEPEPDTEPEPEAEVERVSVEKKVETEVLGETLPRTGASILVLFLSGLLALFVGTSALRRRHNGA